MSNLKKKKKAQELSHLINFELVNNLSNSASSGRRTGGQLLGKNTLPQNVTLQMDSPLRTAQIQAELAAIEELLTSDPVDKESRATYVYKQFFLAHKLGEYSEALDYINQYLELAEADYSVLANQGSTREKLGLLSAALTSYDQALELNSEDEWVWINRGNVLAQLGHTVSAISSYDKALDINPNSKIWFIRQVKANSFFNKP